MAIFSFNFLIYSVCLLFYRFTFLPMISPLQTLITVVQLKPLAGDFMFILLASTTPYVSCTGVGLYTVCFCAAQLLQFPFSPILWYNLKCCLYKLIIYLKAIFVFLSIFVRNSVVLNSNWHTKLTFHRSFFYISHWNSVHKHISNYIIQ